MLTMSLRCCCCCCLICCLIVQCHAVYVMHRQHNSAGILVASDDDILVMEHANIWILDAIVISIALARSLMMVITYDDGGDGRASSRPTLPAARVRYMLLFHPRRIRIYVGIPSLMESEIVGCCSRGEYTYTHANIPLQVVAMDYYYSTCKHYANTLACVGFCRFQQEDSQGLLGM